MAQQTAGGGRDLSWLPPRIQLVVLLLVGWVSRGQQDAITYLREENRVLREQLHTALDGRRLRLTDPQRRRLAICGRALGRKLLAGVAGGSLSAKPPSLPGGRR
jgi:hypothetical protein